MWRKRFILILFIGQLLFNGPVHADGAVSCSLEDPTGQVSSIYENLKSSVENSPPGLVRSYLASVCKEFRKSSRCADDSTLKPIPTKPPLHGICTHYVKHFLLDMFGKEAFEPGFENLVPARDAVRYIKAPFQNVYDPTKDAHPGPMPEESRLEVRVYSGGRAKGCGREPCGHIEICFKGYCTSDYKSIIPIDIADAKSQSSKPHILQAIYILDPSKPVPLVNLK